MGTSTKFLSEVKEGDKLKHRWNPEISIELISQTNKGWKVKQYGDGTPRGKKKVKTAFYDSQDISGPRALFKNESVTEGKKWYNDRKQWEKARTKLNVSDDSDSWDKDSKGKLISMWDDEKGSGWITESSNTPTIAKSGKDIFVDTTFVQLSNKFGKLDHIWMGDFSLDTKDGKVEFNRVNKQIDGFSGRVHKLTGDSKAMENLVKNMKPRVVKESVNENDIKNLPLLRKVQKDWGKDSDLYSDLESAVLGGSKKDIIDVLKNYDVYDDYKRSVKESITEARTVIKTKDGKLHNYPNSKKTDVIKFLTKRGMKPVSNEKDLKSNMDFYVVESIGDPVTERFFGTGEIQTRSFGKDKYLSQGGRIWDNVNEASRRATDLFGDSKHGKAIHQLLKGKWNKTKVQKYFDKIGDSTESDIRFIRIMDGVAKELGLDIRKYKNIQQLEFDMIRTMESLYKDFLTESVDESKKSLQDMIKDADRIKKEYNDLKREYSKSKTETNKTRLAAKEEQLRRVATAIRHARADELDSKTESVEVKSKSVNEATITSIPSFNLESDAYIAMLNMLKNNSKFKKIIGSGLLAYMSGGNPNNILKSMRGMLEGKVVTGKLINGVVTVLNKKSPRIAVTPEQSKTPKIINQFSGVLAAGLMFDFRENTVDMAKMSGDANVINTAKEFSVNRGKDKFKTMMGGSKFGEGVVDTKGMQRVGTALPQTKEDDAELTESIEPKIITQLRDVMKSGYKKLKDPKSGKTMTVDSYSASAIVKVYDALNTANKEKFSSMGLLGMQSTAFKLLK
jgi:hypothetical protein